MNEKPLHATITLERFYPAPLEQVFAEFADPAARAQWSAPSNDVLIYDQSNFRQGGRDVFRCGPPNDLRFRGETTYHVIIPNHRVISSETLDMGNQRLAVSLSTLDFVPTGDGATLRLTVQIVSLAGPDVVQGFESGNRSALENLARHLSANPR